MGARDGVRGRWTDPEHEIREHQGRIRAHRADGHVAGDEARGRGAGDRRGGRARRWSGGSVASLRARPDRRSHAGCRRLAAHERRHGVGVSACASGRSAGCADSAETRLAERYRDPLPSASRFHVAIREGFLGSLSSRPVEGRAYDITHGRALDRPCCHSQPKSRRPNEPGRVHKHPYVDSSRAWVELNYRLRAHQCPREFGMGC